MKELGNSEEIKTGLLSSNQNPMIEVLKSGWMNLGRTGFGSSGVLKSGAMDIYTAKFANLLVGNFEAETVLEIAQLDFYEIFVLA